MKGRTAEEEFTVNKVCRCGSQLVILVSLSEGKTGLKDDLRKRDQ